jgi:small subunit ribosomal protein S16
MFSWLTPRFNLVNQSRGVPKTMVRIRLSRTGSTHNPHYRVVVIDSRKPRDGGYIENLGHYDPRKKTENWLGLDAERAKHWLALGAQPSDRARKLLKEVGAL